MTSNTHYSEWKFGGLSIHIITVDFMPGNVFNFITGSKTIVSQLSARRCNKPFNQTDILCHRRSHFPPTPIPICMVGAVTVVETKFKNRLMQSWYRVPARRKKEASSAFCNAVAGRGLRSWKKVPLQAPETGTTAYRSFSRSIPLSLNQLQMRELLIFPSSRTAFEAKGLAGHLGSSVSGWFQEIGNK